MAHLASQKFVPFLGVLAAGNIQKDAEHRATDDPDIFAFAACCDPANLVADEDAKVSLILAEHCTRGGKIVAQRQAARLVDQIDRR